MRHIARKLDGQIGIWAWSIHDVAGDCAVPLMRGHRRFLLHVSLADTRREPDPKPTSPGHRQPLTAFETHNRRSTFAAEPPSCPYSVIDRPVKPFYDPRWGGWEIPLAGEQRRLAAIVAADVVGYSRLMGRDESGTRAPQIAVRREAFDLRIAAHAYCAGMSMRGTQ